MKKTFTMLTVLLALSLSAQAATVTWEQSDMNFYINWDNGLSNHNSETVKGITLTAGGGDSDYCQFGYSNYNDSYSFIVDNGGTLTFSSSLGNLSSIVISIGSGYSYFDDLDTSTGWSWDNSNGQLTWTGDAASAVMTVQGSSGSLVSGSITSIVFTIVDPNPNTTITWGEADLATIDVPMCSPVPCPSSRQTIKGITVTNLADYFADEYCHFDTSNGKLNDDDWADFSMSNGGSLSFMHDSGELTSIVITCDAGGAEDNMDPSKGWSWDSETKKLTWTGKQAVVVLAALPNSNSFYSGPIESIVFTIEPDEPSDVMWGENELKNIDLFVRDGGPILGQKPTMDGTKLSISAPEEGDYSHFVYTPDNGQTSLWCWGNGTLTFEPLSGKLSRLVIYGIVNEEQTNLEEESGWTHTANRLVWTGDDQSKVVLKNAAVGQITGVGFTFGTEPVVKVLPVGDNTEIKFDGSTNNDGKVAITLAEGDQIVGGTGSGYVAMNNTVSLTDDEVDQILANNQPDDNGFADLPGVSLVLPPAKIFVKLNMELAAGYTLVARAEGATIETIEGPVTGTTYFTCDFAETTLVHIFLRATNGYPAPARAKADDEDPALKLFGITVTDEDDTTTGIEAISNQQSEISSLKILRDGQLLILRDGKTYTMQGVEVR